MADLLALFAVMFAMGGAGAGLLQDWKISAVFWTVAFVVKTTEALVLRHRLKKVAADAV